MEISYAKFCYFTGRCSFNFPTIFAVLKKRPPSCINKVGGLIYSTFTANKLFKFQASSFMLKSIFEVNAMGFGSRKYGRTERLVF